MARPAKSIDYINIEITASAQNASQELERLTKNVQNLSNALSGANVNPLVQGLKQLSSATKGVRLGSLNSQINRLANNMQKYIRGVKGMQATNKTFAQSFKAIGNGVQSSYSLLSRINNKINDFALKMRRASGETSNLASKIGLLYAKFFLLIRGIKGIVKAVKSSMDYIEVLHYFDESFGKVAEHGVSKWSDMGAESAQAYYDSFKERAKKVTTDMSGFFPESDGSLTPTNKASLGMNPQDLMKYQGLYVQIADSMGMTAEQSTKLSEALVKIGADLASFRNEDFDKTWQNMASGLVGMTKTMRQYGVNISVANMNMKLHEMGINTTVNKLSEADKALLRTIILLESSTGAWGDLAKTLNTPANQFRILTNNIKLLGQLIGNIFLPVVAKILPYLNALVIALQRLFIWLAKILHIDLSSLTAGGSSGFDDGGMSDLLGDAEDVGEALEDDTEQAKKFKKQLQGFDALNNLTTKEDDSGGLDTALASGLLNDAFNDALDKYLKAWQDAFDKINDKARKIADNIVKFFKRLAKPIADAWAKVGDKVKDQWYRAGKALKLLFEHIGRDFWRVWEEPETVKIFENLFTIFGNLGETVFSLANRIREAWDANDNGYRILSSIRDIILIISEHFKDMSESTVEWARNLNLEPLMGKIAEWLESLEPVINNVMGIIKDFYNQVLLPLGKWVLEKGLPDLLQVFIDFNNDVDWEGIREKLSELWEHLEPFAETVGEGFIEFVERVTGAVKDFVNGEKFEGFLDKIEKWMDNVTADDVADALEKIAKGIVGIKLAVWGFGLLSGAVTVFKTLIDVCKGVKGVGSIFLGGAKKLGQGIGIIVDKLSGGALTSLGGLKGLMTMDLGTIFGAGTATEIGLTIGAGILGGIITAIEGFKLGKWLGEHVFFEDDASWYQNFSWFGEGGFFDELSYFVTEMIPQKFNELKENCAVGIINAGYAISEKKSEWDASFEELKVGIGLKTLEIVDKFVEFKEGIAKTLGETRDDMKLKLDEASAKFDEFKTNVSNRIDEAKKSVSEKLDEWSERFDKWKENLENKTFDSETWRAIFDKIRQGAQNAWTDISNWWNNTVVKKLNQWVKDIKDAIADIKRYFAEMKQEMQKSENWNWNFSWKNNRNTRGGAVGGRIYANGGFPEDGMFFANHNELVGKFANGQTAVANNEQIVSGIENGVYGAMSESNALLMEQNNLLQAILEKETGITASDIFNSVRSSADAYYRMNGRKAFT